MTAMRGLLLFLLPAAVNCLPTNNGTREKDSPKDLIIGGSYIDIDSVPYFVQILQNERQVCGGSIIAQQWIVSAAHCFIGVSASGTSVLSGSDHRESGNEHEVQRIIIHASFDQRSTDNDIALLKLVQPMEFNSEQKSIEIATTAPKTGEKVLVTGFGKTESWYFSHYLRATVVSVVDQSSCRRNYGQESVDITENMFCAAKARKDSCQGDSGGPAVINGKLSGIVSFGIGCASRLYPGVYTRVYNYRKWIASKTGLQL